MAASSNSVGGEIDVVVTRRDVEADGIISLELRDAGGGPLPAFTAGSHIDVMVTADLTRQYSLMNDPAETDRYVIGVLREPNSRGGSAAVHDHFLVGRHATISTPRNHFPLTEGAGRTILLAGGIGVTPMLAMAHRLTALGAEFALHYCARTKTRAAFLDLIDASAFAARAHIHFDDGAPEQYFSAERDLSPIDDAHLYVCGPGGFMDFVIGGAKALGWPHDNIHLEYFSNTIVEDGNRAFTVRLARSGRELTIPADKSIANVLKENGVAVPVACEEGICGACLTGVISGLPHHRDVFMTDEEHEANKEMTLCCSRAKGDLLVLDI